MVENGHRFVRDFDLDVCWALKARLYFLPANFVVKSRWALGLDDALSVVCWKFETQHVGALPLQKVVCVVSQGRQH